MIRSCKYTTIFSFCKNMAIYFLKFKRHSISLQLFFFSFLIRYTATPLHRYIYSYHMSE